MTTRTMILAAAALALGTATALTAQPATTPGGTAPAQPATPADPSAGTAATPASPATPAEPATAAKPAKPKKHVFKPASDTDDAPVVATPGAHSKVTKKPDATATDKPDSTDNPH